MVLASCLQGVPAFSVLGSGAPGLKIGLRLGGDTMVGQVGDDGGCKGGTRPAAEALRRRVTGPAEVRTHSELCRIFRNDETTHQLLSMN